MEKLSASLLRVQGIYMMVVSVCALMGINRVMQVSDATAEVWVIQVLSVLLICAGLGFLHASYTKDIYFFNMLFPFLFTGAMLFIDLYYPLQGYLPKIYIADAFSQMVFLCGWLHIFIRMAVKNKIAE